MVAGSFSAGGGKECLKDKKPQYKGLILFDSFIVVKF